MAQPRSRKYPGRYDGVTAINNGRTTIRSSVARHPESARVSASLGLGMLPGYHWPVTVTESDFDLVFAALAKRNVRYLVVALDALTSLAYRPRAPVPLAGLCRFFFASRLDRRERSHGFQSLEPRPSGHGG